MKRIFLAVLVVGLLGIGLGLYVFYQAYDAARDSHEDLERPGEQSELREKKVTLGDDPMSILLIGMEDYAAEGEGGRADTQIVVTLDPSTKAVTMTSIPRDTRVEFPAEKVGDYYGGLHKINASHRYGALTDYGANKLAVETVESFLDIPIDKFVTVDFNGFRNIVDTLDGVTVNIEHPFWEENTDNERIYFEEGPEKLDGEEALAFVRMRKRDINSVYPREQRQRQFIRAAVDEIISAGTVFKVGEIGDILRKNVSTNLRPREMYALQRDFASKDSLSMETIKIDGANQYIDGISYFIPKEGSLDEVKQQLKGSMDLSSEKDEEEDEDVTLNNNENSD